MSSCLTFLDLTYVEPTNVAKYQGAVLSLQTPSIFFAVKILNFLEEL